MRYFLKIDKICEKCGFRNQASEESFFPIEIIACGKCGHYMLTPDNITIDDKKEIDTIITNEIKRREEQS